jgi:hybrid cluster-associated redox disulfide protein
MALFNKEMLIIQALEKHPDASAVFEQHGMSCCICMGATIESIEAGAIMHAIDPQIVVDQLNQLGLDRLAHEAF